MQRDLAAVCDAVHSARLAIGYLQERSFEEFSDDVGLQDAVVFRIVVIGETTRRISEQFRARYPHIPWIEARNMRNRIVHDYDRINLQTVWDTVNDDLPLLIEQLQAILDANPPE